MRLYHVTTKDVHGAIVREGIDPRYSKGKLRACWYVTEGMLSWAMMHVMRRHGVGMHELIAFEVSISAARVTKRRKKVYSCEDIIAPDKLHALFEETADPGEECGEEIPESTEG